MISLARGSVGAGLALLVVGHRHHPEGEDLVDLRGVEERPGALGRDLGVVVEDDRRPEHQIGVARCPREHRPAPILMAPGDDLDRVVGRFEQRHEVDVVTLQQEVCADQRGAGCGIFVTNLRKVDVRNPHPELGVPVVGNGARFHLRA